MTKLSESVSTIQKLEENPVHTRDFELFLVKVEKALKGGPQFKILSGIPHPP